jgi:hypothetical protein
MTSLRFETRCGRQGREFAVDPALADLYMDRASIPCHVMPTHGKYLKHAQTRVAVVEGEVLCSKCATEEGVNFIRRDSQLKASRTRPARARSHRAAIRDIRACSTRSHARSPSPALPASAAAARRGREAGWKAALQPNQREIEARPTRAAAPQPARPTTPAPFSP